VCLRMDFVDLTKTVLNQVLLEQLTSSPWNNFLFMSYYGLVVEGNDHGLVLKCIVLFSL